MRDYGVGLKPGEATRVFSRFWRADPARARTTGGTGLGLSIALEDARLHGGWLQAWGEPGGGSQFRLTLPRTADEPLRGSPIPLEPKDSRRNRGLDDPAQAYRGGEKSATVPVQPAREPLSPAHAPLAPRMATVTPTADPTALPGNGARVVARPTAPATRNPGEPTRGTDTDRTDGKPTGRGRTATDRTGTADSDTPHRPDAGPQGPDEQGGIPWALTARSAPGAHRRARWRTPPAAS